MKIDSSILILIFQAAGFLVTVCMIYGGHVALKKDVERLEADRKRDAEHLAETLKRIEDNQAQHAKDDKERFTEIGLLMKADQAATANLHETLRDTRFEVRTLLDWRDRMERRNGPGPHPPLSM